MSIGNVEKNNLIEQCILSLSEGKMDKMEALYNLIKDDVYAFALSKVCNKYDADDIMQDTFVQIYKNAQLYVCKGKPLSWIFTIESNLINRYFQLKNRKVELNEDVINNIPSQENVYCEEDNYFLKSLLVNLTKHERQVIALHIVSSLKFKEIADLLSLPLSTVLSKYNRAIKKLKKIAKEEKYEN